MGKFDSILKYIKDYFTAGSAFDIVGKVLLLLGVTLMYYVVFFYAKKHNLNMLTLLIGLCLAFMCILAFADIPNYQTYVWLVLVLICVACLILFAQEFKRDLFRRSRKRRADKNSEALSREELQDSAEEIIKACQRLSKTDTGALILVADAISDSILDSGTLVNAKISADLLRTLFFPKTALHDGAVIIMHNTVVAAGCYLPLPQEDIYPREFGTRHRAAIGVSEAFPSLTAIVVSEETGIISAMHDSKIKRYLGAEQLREILYSAMGLSDQGEEERIWGWTVDEKE